MERDINKLMTKLRKRRKAAEKKAEASREETERLLLELRNEYERTRYHSNPEVRRKKMETANKWKADNKDKYNALMARYRENNREKINEYAKEWMRNKRASITDEEREKRNAYQREYMRRKKNKK
jgi:hypothetical protein